MTFPFGPTGSSLHWLAVPSGGPGVSLLCPPLFLTHSGLDLSVRKEDVLANLDSPCLCFGKVIYE